MKGISVIVATFIFFSVHPFFLDFFISFVCHHHFGFTIASPYTFHRGIALLLNMVKDTNFSKKKAETVQHGHFTYTGEIKKLKKRDANCFSLKHPGVL